MKTTKLFLILSFLGMIVGCSTPQSNLKPHLPELELIKALPVDGIEPSGLVYHNGELYTVSDKQKEYVFRLAIKDGEMLMEPHLEFDPTPLQTMKYIDYEGITVDENGDFYIVSETHCQIMKINAETQEAAWLTPSLKEMGQANGFFQERNANFEGLTYLGNHTFIACAERQPRGLFIINASTEPADVRMVNGNSTRLDIAAHRTPDFSGLHYEDGTLYALLRGASAVCEVEYETGKFAEKECWSYAATETDSAYAYSYTKYGLAEGLAMDDDHIYIIFDNNKDSRQNNPDDHRPQLFIFKRPGS